MKRRYEAIVIGTGFGGAVSACRLAQAGIDVGVLERGRRYPMNGFPRDWSNVMNGWLWEKNQGLFDVKPISDVFVVQSAGYGGGSLIYANVHLRPPPEAFARDWPEGYSRQALDPYYDLVAYMLDVKPISASQPLGLPPKTRIMSQIAERLGRAEQFCYPNLAVNFSEPNRPSLNKFGVTQNGCNHCGECDIGCNIHAKNTLDLNYLALAERAGADVTTQCEVFKIEPLAAGYRIHYRDHRNDVVGQTEADSVFLCAGAVNTTELLLRCRDEYRTLGDLSPRLGHRYSGNGDFLAFAFDTREKFQPSVGPTITTGIVYDRPNGNDDTWFIFQEGGHPREIARLLQWLNPRDRPKHQSELGGVPMLEGTLAREIVRVGREMLGDSGPLGDDVAVFLAMGRDRANGRISLTPVTRLLRIQWDVPSNLPLYSAEARLSMDVAKELGGQIAYNPFWKVLHQPVAVHNLGGCVMGDDPIEGVTDAYGEVYGYPSMYVMDGAALPAATGTNPSHTIAAVAERNVEAAIRRIKKDPGWTAPERAMATPVVDPLTRIKIPKKGTRLPSSTAIGLTFTETMRGFLGQGFSPTDTFGTATEAGRRANSTVEFTLTITAPDLDAFLVDRNHTAIAQGRLRVDGFTPPEGVPITNGVFNLFVPGEDVFERRMLYALPFHGADGKPYLLDGFKDVRRHDRLDVWPATTTLYTVIREGHDHDGAILAAGIMRIRKKDFMRQLTTFRVTGTDNVIEQVNALRRFGELFIGMLLDVFVRPQLED
jgi:cholesterol oxidase